MNVCKMPWAETGGVLIKAVIESGCLIARLFFESYTDPGHMDSANLWSDDLDEDINSVAQNLTAFDLDVDCHDTETVLESVKQVLSQARELNILTIRHVGSPLSYDFAEVSSSVVSISLKAINISNVYCKESDLVSLLSNQRATIEHLWLCDIRLVGSWRSLV